MPPLITREEAPTLGEHEDPVAITALVQLVWEVRRDRFGDSTDLRSLVQPQVRRLRGGLRLLRPVRVRGRANRGRGHDTPEAAARRARAA